MTAKMLNARRREREQQKRRLVRALYPRDIAGDAAPQLPPPKGSRRPEFCRPLRKFTRRRRRGGQTPHTGWGFGFVTARLRHVDVTP